MGQVNIVQIVTTDDLVYTVGEECTVLLGRFARIQEVERIFYEKNGYNKGRQGEFSAYVVQFVNENRAVIPQERVCRIVTEYLDVDANAEVVLDLPG
jgi:hypothetical protein